METLIVYAETPEKSEVLKAVMQIINISYETEQDTTEHLLSTEANRQALQESLLQVKKGKTSVVNLNEIWN